MTNNTRNRFAALAVFLLAVAVYWRTAYPTITWWDSSNYSMAAATLGIASAPGSLLLTLLGWPVAHLPFVSSPAHALNLFAGVLAAVTAAMVYVISSRLLRGTRTDDVSTSASAGIALGALTLAFGDTLWDHAIKFQPYVLTAVFTTLILWTMLRWWETADDPNSWKRLVLLSLLFGLDYSVHRTNALMIPGALVWVLLRKPQIFREPRVWLGSAAGMAAGLAVQLLLIPIANVTRSPLSFNAPTTFARFWQYESIADRGGSFLVKFYPRNSALWSVQVADFLHVLRQNFLNLTGSAGVLGALPALAAAFGLLVLWRRNRRLGLALTLVLVLQSVVTVLYFNIPANFFRTFDRHYLPVCVTIAVLMAIGLGVSMQWLASRRATTLAAALLVAVPSTQLVNNWTARDASRNYFTRDYAENALKALPPRAIYFTVGDNDTFPVMYLQSAEGVRPDVRIVNTSIANMPTFGPQMRRRDPTFPLPVMPVRESMAPIPWKKEWLMVPINATAEQLGLAPDTAIPATIALQVQGTNGAQMLPADEVLREIVRTSQWRDPLAFAITGSTSSMTWLAPYGRLEGMYWRIVPVLNPRIDIPRLRANLLEHYSYRGYADSSVQLTDVDRGMAAGYYSALDELQKAEKDSGNVAGCRSAAARILAALPPERIGLPVGLRERVVAKCGAASLP